MLTALPMDRTKLKALCEKGKREPNEIGALLQEAQK